MATQWTPRYPPVGAKCMDPYSPLYNPPSSDEYKPRYPLLGALDPYAPPPRKTYAPGMESLHKRMIPKIKPVVFQRPANDPFSNPDIPALARRRAARATKVEIADESAGRSESEDDENIQTPRTTPGRSANASFSSLDEFALVPIYHDKIYGLQRKVDSLRQRIRALEPTLAFWNSRGDQIVHMIEVTEYHAHRWPASLVMQRKREIETAAQSLAKAVRFLAYYKGLQALLEETTSALQAAVRGHEGVEEGEDEE